MNVQKMMKEMQKIQGRMARIQSELEDKVFTGDAGGGMVAVEMSGRYDVQSVCIKPEVVDPDDVEALEDLVLAAVQSAKSKVDEESRQKMGGLSSGMKIPGL